VTNQWQYDPRQQQHPATPPQRQQQAQYPPQPYAQQSQPYGYGQPAPVQVNVTQNANGPRRAVTQGKLGYGETMFHWCMIICSAGLWYPVYASRKRSKRSVTKYR
jgi:hypothetical protein